MNDEENYQHQPVLLTEVLDNLSIKSDGIYVDATFGRGGHAQAILSRLGPNGRLLAMDKDPEAIAYAYQHFANDKRFSIRHGSFKELATFLHAEGVHQKVDGILFDLGVSSPQLDKPDRGFSFLREGLLDMRMDSSKGLNAAAWLQKISEQELATALWEYGEEKFSRRIARAIIAARKEKLIETTRELAEIIAAAHPAWEKGKHPATRSFQAIRIVINQELDDLSEGLTQSLEELKVGGRLLVISFHSLEDRIVKNYIQNQERGAVFPVGLPIKAADIKPRLKKVGRPIKPNAQEIVINPRARSAVLRIAEKLS